MLILAVVLVWAVGAVVILALCHSAARGDLAPDHGNTHGPRSTDTKVPTDRRPRCPA
jgi:hypothetical protein